MLKLYTSKQILGLEDLYDLQDTYTCSGTAFQYRLTAPELGWLDFIKNKYAIYDLLMENLEGEILTFNFDSMELGETLEADSVHYSAVCLSDETALQKLFFWLACEPESREVV